MLLTILAVVLGYAFVMGFFYSIRLHSTVASCPEEIHEYYESQGYGKRLVREDCRDYHSDGIGGLALVWPLSLPLLLGNSFGSIISPSERSARREKKNDRRREEEMEEAQHKTALSAERAKQLEVLEREAGLVK